ncbi:phospholipid N-methyltransferase [Tritrichomonas foetus]|uniref:phosphatidyl-N-methylethanolamine N-methyltransferase n=1 Tax=Tritrichomonas foetus TaxID=1144522 RepID=A0A1J4KIQ1_9EUKA|nr:phospholipid N-methyltransferase [Tritrichomonas foetus]|eukprot:OHT09558.1 phospholipid N-methyltransferase [Tritrichomonas foetus]
MNFSVLIASVSSIIPYFLYGYAYLFPNRILRYITQSQFIDIIKFFKTVTFLSILPLTYKAGLNIPGVCVGGPLILIGEYLNEMVYRLLGIRGVFYGAEFGSVKPKEKLSQFPFTMSDPQLKGSLMIVIGACMCLKTTRELIAVTIPWVFSYFFLMIIENHSVFPNDSEIIQS